MSILKAKYWIEQLELLKHPEGGYFSEIYRGKTRVQFSINDTKIERNSATSIYFLLESKDVSRFHQLTFDEIWYYHMGSPTTICVFNTDDTYEEIVLGPEIENGQKMQVVIPSKSIFGAFVNRENDYTLMGCVVSPGFEFEDFKLIDKKTLLTKFPDQKDIITKLGN